MKRKIQSILALAFVVNLSTQAQNLMVGLQACYQLDNNAINGAATGAALNGSPVGVTGTTDRFGNANSAYAFSGTNGSYVSLPPNPLIKPTTSVSFSGWVKFNNVTNPQALVFAKNACGIYFEGYQLNATVISGGFKLSVVKSAASCSSGGQQILTGTTTLTTGVWYHVGLYAGTDSLKVFLNGVQDAAPVASPAPFSYDASAGVVLGGTATSPNYPFNGAMDAARFYNRKLTNTEFFQLYTTTPACSYSLLNGLQACYPFNCDTINYAPTAAVPPSLNGTRYNVVCDTGHTNAPNTAYKFAGNINSYIKLPNDSRIKPTNGVSFSCWAKLDANTAPYQYLAFAKNTCSAWFEGYALTTIKVGSQIRYQVAKGSSAVVGCSTQGVLTSSNLYNPFTWHHVVFYMDNYFIKLYVDGVLDNVIASPVIMNYDASSVILGGSNQPSHNYPLNGSMDNVRIYDRELTAKEINTLNWMDPTCNSDWGTCYNYNSYMQYLMYCHREDKTVGVNETISLNTSVELFPNPSAGKVYMRNAKDASVVIYDINGKSINYSINQLDETTSEINLTENATGIYFFKISDANGNVIQTTKIILTR